MRYVREVDLKHVQESAKVKEVCPQTGLIHDYHLCMNIRLDELSARTSIYTNSRECEP